MKFFVTERQNIGLVLVNENMDECNHPNLTVTEEYGKDAVRVSTNSVRVHINNIFPQLLGVFDVYDILEGFEKSKVIMLHCGPVFYKNKEDVSLPECHYIDEVKMEVRVYDHEYMDVPNRFKIYNIDCKEK